MKIAHKEIKSKGLEFADASERYEQAKARVQKLAQRNINDSEVREALRAQRWARHAFFEARVKLLDHTRFWVGAIFGDRVGGWC